MKKIKTDINIDIVSFRWTVALLAVFRVDPIERLSDYFLLLNDIKF